MMMVLKKGPGGQREQCNKGELGEGVGPTLHSSWIFGPSRKWAWYRGDVMRRAGSWCSRP
jgi:hypothetical protein